MAGARAAGGDALVKMNPWRQSAQHRWYPEAAERIRQGTLDHAVRVRRPHARRCGSQQGRTCLPAEPRRSLCAIAPRDRRCGSLKRRRCPRVDSLQQDQLRPLGASRHHPCGRRRCAARNCFPLRHAAALDDRMIVLGGERITQFSSNLAMVAMPVSARCCAHPIRRRPRRA